MPTVDPATGEIQLSPGELFAPFFRSGFNYDRDRVSLETGVDAGGPSLTQQQFREEADINTIVKRFGLTGQLPDNPRVPTYGDFTGVTDYHSAMLAVRQAEEAFMALPASIRAEFANDPQRLIEAVDDPQQQDKLIELGLATKKAPATAEIAAGSAPSPSEATPLAKSTAPASKAKQSAGPPPSDQSST